MNSINSNNIFVCFYGSGTPYQISSISYSIENDNITESENYYCKIPYNKTDYINLFRVITIGDKSKAYIAFATYETGGYTIIYDINQNSYS